MPPISKLVLCSCAFDLEELFLRSCITMNHQKWRTKTTFDGWFLLKVDIKCFLFTINRVMQQHMVYREKKIHLCQLSVCSLALFCWPMLCCHVFRWSPEIRQFLERLALDYLTLVKKVNCSKCMVLPEYTGVKGILEKCKTPCGAWRKGDAGE